MYFRSEELWRVGQNIGVLLNQGLSSFIKAIRLVNHFCFDLFIFFFLVDASLRSERGFQVRHEVFGKMEKNYCTANFMKSIFVSVSPWRLITNSSTELKRLKVEISTLGFPSYLTYILWNENLYYFLINSNMCENINFASSASPLGGYDSY